MTLMVARFSAYGATLDTLLHVARIFAERNVVGSALKPQQPSRVHRATAAPIRWTELYLKVQYLGRSIQRCLRSLCRWTVLASPARCHPALEACMSVGGPPLTERYPELSASSRSWRSHEQRPELLPRRLMSTGATGGMLYTWYWADCCSVDEGPPLGASSMQRAATIKAVAGARRRGCRRRGAWCRLPDQPSARAPINGRERRCTCPPVACWATARPSPTGIAARTPPSCRVSPDAWRAQPETRVAGEAPSPAPSPCTWPSNTSGAPEPLVVAPPLPLARATGSCQQTLYVARLLYWGL